MRSQRATFEELWNTHIQDLETIDRLDLLILRHHAFLESALRDLLRLRLHAAAGEIGDLTFAKLASLALAGCQPKMKALVLHLNRIRNYVAHDATASELEPELKEFVKSQPYSVTAWPAGATAKLAVLRQVLLSVSLTVAIITKSIEDLRESFANLKPGDDPPIAEGTLIGQLPDKLPPQAALYWIAKQHGIPFLKSGE
jgi:hypothetical protein